MSRIYVYYTFIETHLRQHITADKNRDLILLIQAGCKQTAEIVINDYSLLLPYIRTSIIYLYDGLFETLPC